MCGNLAAVLQPIRAQAANACFANFFRLLLAAVSISQWVILCRLLPRTAGSLPLPWGIAGAAAIYLFNRQLAIRTRRRRHDRNPVGAMPRLYYAIAFTCLVCVLFLLLTDAFWMTGEGVSRRHRRGGAVHPPHPPAVRLGTRHHVPLAGERRHGWASLCR